MIIKTKIFWIDQADSKVVSEKILESYAEIPAVGSFVGTKPIPYRVAKVELNENLNVNVLMDKMITLNSN